MDEKICHTLLEVLGNLQIKRSAGRPAKVVQPSLTMHAGNDVGLQDETGAH